MSLIAAPTIQPTARPRPPVVVVVPATQEAEPATQDAAKPAQTPLTDSKALQPAEASVAPATLKALIEAQAMTHVDLRLDQAPKDPGGSPAEPAAQSETNPIPVVPQDAAAAEQQASPLAEQAAVAAQPETPAATPLVESLVAVAPEVMLAAATTESMAPIKTPPLTPPPTQLPQFPPPVGPDPAGPGATSDLASRLQRNAALTDVWREVSRAYAAGLLPTTANTTARAAAPAQPAARNSTPAGRSTSASVPARQSVRV